MSDKSTVEAQSIARKTVKGVMAVPLFLAGVGLFAVFAIATDGAILFGSRAHPWRVVALTLLGLFAVLALLLATR